MVSFFQSNHRNGESMNKIKQADTVVSKAKAVIKKAVLKSRSCDEARRQIEKADIGLSNITVTLRGPFQMKVFYRIDGEDRMRDVVCERG